MNKIPLKLQTKATISFLEARVTEKNTLKKLGKEFIFTLSKIDKTCTAKDTERNKAEFLLQLQDRDRVLLLGTDEGMQLIMEHAVREKGRSGFNQVTIFLFSDTILLWCENTRSLMENFL